MVVSLTTHFAAQIELRLLDRVCLPKCTELPPRDCLIGFLHERAAEEVSLMKWPVRKTADRCYSLVPWLVKMAMQEGERSQFRYQWCHEKYFQATTMK